MLRGNANMWHKSALPATESHSVQPRSGLVASPDPHVECTRCSATGAALMRVVLACLRCAPKARHRQGHKPDPQRDCGPGRVASSMACDHGERTCSPHDADLAHGTDKAAIAQPPVAARRH